MLLNNDVFGKMAAGVQKNYFNDSAWPNRNDGYIPFKLLDDSGNALRDDSDNILVATE
jgi:hypothetical protein